MDARARATFLALILAQAAHSVEEYVFRLYDVFTPARLVSSLVSDNLATGFAIANAAIVAFGFWCYFARVRRGHPSSVSWAWPWVAIELANGIVHPAIALTQRQYFPGVVTAPLLLILAAYLATRLWRSRRMTSHA